MTRSRRSLLVAAPLALLLGVPLAAGPGPVAEAATPAAVPARSADAFVDSIGVATHLTYTGTPYLDYGLVERRIAESGIRHLRDGWGTGSAYASTFVRERLGPLGVKITMVHDPKNNATAAQQKEMVKSQLLPVIAGAESLNEPDLRGAGWAAAARDWTVQMSQAYRSDPATRHVPLLGPSMANTNSASNHAAMGDLSPYVDYGNAHDYPGDQFHMTDQIMDTVFANQGRLAPGKPVMATETGFSNGPTAAPYPVMPEAQSGPSLARLHLDHFRRGYVRTFSYELFDQRTDSGFESRFGLLRHDGTPKPAFTAVKNMISLLSDRGPAFAPGALAYSLDGGDGATRSMLLAKRDGSYWIAVWQQAKQYDGRQVLDPADRALTLTLGSPAASVRQYRPTLGAGVAAEASGVRTVPVTASEHPLLVEVRGAGTAPEVPGAAPAPETVAPEPAATPAPAPAPVPAPAPAARTWVSDTAWTQVRNGWGPVETDRSNGEAARGDGRTLTLGGTPHTKGLGVHAGSEVRVPTGGASTFTATVGVDAEVGTRGSVVFQVWAGTTRLADSGVLRGGQAPRTLTADVRGHSEIRLVVSDAGDGMTADHADWASAALTR